MFTRDRIGRLRGRVPPPPPPPPLSAFLKPEIGHFHHFFWTATPSPAFLDQIVVKSSHERMHPPPPLKKNFLDHLMNYHLKV